MKAIAQTPDALVAAKSAEGRGRVKVKSTIKL